MKIQYKAVAVLCVLGSLILAGCNGDDHPPANGDPNVPTPADPVVVITATEDGVTLKDTEVKSYDFTSLFTITKDGVSVAVLNEYVDSTLVSETAGSYPVTCSYEGKHKSVTVTVTATLYSVESDTEIITLRASQVSEYDFKQHFTAKTDGVQAAITDAMIRTDVAPSEGRYSYTVTHGGASKTISVVVEADVLIVNSYRVKEIALNALADYDYTDLFSLYADGEAVRVTESMIDTAELAFAEIGKEYKVRISYFYKGVTYTGSAVVKAVEEERYTVSTKNIVTYPHGENIDLTTLFEVKRGDETVPVTLDMISGSIDYTKVGVNTLTLSFGGAEYQSTVEIKYGVILEYANSDTVTVQKGTDKKNYPFAKDFKAIVNGIPFLVIPESNFSGLDELDFDKAGSYKVTLQIAYNVEPPKGLDATVDFEYAEKTITYIVEEKTVQTAVKQELVTAPQGTAEYNPFSNLTVTVNGIPQFLTDNPDWADGYSTCYARLLSDPIDFTSAERQEVRVAVYPYGNDAEPVVLTYGFIIQTDIVITAEDVGIFAGGTLFATELFTVTEGGKPVEVTFDMISGKADTFRAGVYTLELSYGGARASATVTVFDGGMKGIYRTLLTTIPFNSDDDDDNESDDWGDLGGAEGYASALSARATNPVYVLDNLVIGEDGSIMWGSRAATVVGGLDENTLIIKIGSNEFTLYYSDGIVVLDAANPQKLGFNDERRPMVFFNEAQWSMIEHVTVNYSSEYVLSSSFISYSIDTFRIKDKADGRELWYALKVELAEKTSADTHYVVTWGEAEYADGFVAVEGTASTLTFMGEEYRFVMQSSRVGKVSRSSSTQSKFAGKSFRGTLNGANAVFSVTQSDGYELTAGGKRVFYLSANDVNNSKNCYADQVTDTIFLYSVTEKFSYTFKLDMETLTFTVLEKDAYYGFYQADNKLIFFDGYGTGTINFDTNSWSSTQIRYTVNSGVVSVRYVNTKPSFAYGSGAEFYLGEFLNTLTVKSFADGSLDGLTFENTLITDGAIVRISSYRFGADVTRGPSLLLDAISIITKDGELTGEAKRECVDMSAVVFSAPGFHRLAVNLTVKGEAVTAYYTVQIVPKRYEGNPLFTAYGAGVMLKTNSLTLDEFGQIVLDCSGVRYEGFADLEGKNSFSVKAYSKNGAFVVAQGEMVADGILRFTATGAVSFTDYYTTGTSRVVAAGGVALREFTVGNNRTYIFSGSPTLAGDVVTVKALTGSVENGNVVKIVKGEEITYVRILSWGNVTEGLSVLKDYQE